LNTAENASLSLLDASQSCLVLIDFQPRLLRALKDSELALTNARRLANAAKLLQVPTFATEQNPEKLGSGDEELASLADETFKKMCFGAAASDLSARLSAERSPQQGGRDRLVIAGCEAHICLLQTAMQFRAAGLEVFVVSDACASRTEQNWQAAMHRLEAKGCEIVTTEMVLFEWLGTADHPQFRAIQGLIK